MRLYLSVPAILLGITLFMTPSQAAFIVEADSVGPVTGKAFGNFSSLGHSFSATPSTAVGLVGNQSVFGNPANSTGPDEYTFSYTPGTDVDNTPLVSGTLLGNSAALDADGSGPIAPTYAIAPHFATGLTGGGSGLYNVYFTVPPSGNVDPAGSLIEVSSDLPIPTALNPVNMNSGGTGPDDPPGGAFTGGMNDMWLRIGVVPLTAGTTYTVRVTANIPSFVSQRGHGVMWELVVPIPEPATSALLTVAGFSGLMLRRRGC